MIAKGLKLIGLFILFELARIGLASVIVGLKIKGVAISEMEMTTVIIAAAVIEIATLTLFVFSEVIASKPKAKVLTGNEPAMPC